MNLKFDKREKKDKDQRYVLYSPLLKKAYGLVRKDNIFLSQFIA